MTSGRSNKQQSCSEGSDHVDRERKVDDAGCGELQTGPGRVWDGVEAEHQGPLERRWNETRHERNSVRHINRQGHTHTQETQASGDKLYLVANSGVACAGSSTAKGTRSRHEQLHDCAPYVSRPTRRTFLEYATAGSTVSSSATWTSSAWHSTSPPRKSHTPWRTCPGATTVRGSTSRTTNALLSITFTQICCEYRRCASCTGAQSAARRSRTAAASSAGSTASAPYSTRDENVFSGTEKRTHLATVHRCACARVCRVGGERGEWRVESGGDDKLARGDTTRMVREKVESGVVPSLKTPSLPTW